MQEQPTIDAAIYHRVSTERQNLKATPEEMLAECLAYCKAHGYNVTEAHIYRDLEKYRVGSRLVEPSATRHDRPAWLRMLSDFDAKRFTVIVAWREDRLYRGINKALTDILNRVRKQSLTVEVVHGHFDKISASFLAAAAEVELEARSERTAAGRAAAYASGKVHPGNVPYGYKLIAPDPAKTKEREVVIDEAEAQWVRSIYDWYNAGVSFNEMRRRLIAGGAQQRRATSFGKGIATPWAKGVIQKILRNVTYATGEMHITMQETTGQDFTLTLPKIISAEAWENARDQRKRNKVVVIHNTKHQYLALGLVYCKVCGVRLGGKTRRRHGHEYSYLTCPYHDSGATDRSRGCCQSVSNRKFERELWAKVWRVMTDDDFFKAQVQAKIDALRAAEQDAAAELDKHRAALDDIAMRRAVVIDLAARKRITEDDLDLQLASIDLDALHHRKRVSELSLLSGDRSGRILSHIDGYRAHIRDGGDFLNLDPCPPELAAKQLELRREVVNAVVERVTVDADRTIETTFVFDLSLSWSMPKSDNSSMREFIGNSSLKDFKLWAAK